MKNIVKLLGFFVLLLLLSACSFNKTVSDIKKDTTVVEYKEGIKDDIKIDDELVQIIIQNLNDNLHEVPLNSKKIYWYKYSELETDKPFEYLFDIDNDGIEDKIEVYYGTAYSYCNNISWGTGNSKYVLGNYSGGLYDESIPLSEIDETQMQIEKLDFFRYKDFNYILDSNTITANYEIRLYHNTELVDVVNIRNTKNKEDSVTVWNESNFEEVLKNEEELEIKIKEYIDALNPWGSVATSIPEFSNINEANKYWIRDCMRMYFKENYDQNMYYDYELYFQKEAEKIKDILFGKELTNYEYIEPEITGAAYDMQRTYIKNIEQIGELYKVTTIPYKVFDSGWEEVRELNNIDIYDLTDKKVCTLTYTYEENEDFKQVKDKIEQYLKENEHEFTKQVLEIKLDEKTGNLHIVSSTNFYLEELVSRVTKMKLYKL